MTRTVDATLHAALQAGTGKPIATGYIGYSDGSVSVSGPVSAFKLTGTTLKFTINKITTFAGDQTHMWLTRGLTIAGVDYTITTGRFAIHNQQYLPNKTQVLDGGLFPNTYYSANGNLTYDQVITAFCTAYGKTAVYREPAEAWHAYKFLAVGKNLLLNSAMGMLNVLQQKRLIQMCDLGSEQVLVFCTDAYGATDLSITVKDDFEANHTMLGQRQFIWQDENNVYHQNGTITNPIHNLGYMESTDSPPARHSPTHLFHAVIRPDLRMLDGDRISFTMWGAASSSMFAKITEQMEADSRGVPQWRTIAEANTCFNNTEAGQTTTNIERTSNYIPVSTSQFTGHLSDKDNNLQHALDTLDHTRETVAAARNYYVRTDGNDTNTGRSATAGGAFLTMQRAIDVCLGLDFNGFTATIHVADGTYAGGVSVTQPFTNGTVIIHGDTVTPANVICSSATPFIVTNGAALTIGGFKLTGAAGNCLYAGTRGTITVDGKMIYNCAGALNANTGGQILITADYTISASQVVHWWVTGGGYLAFVGLTITLSGTPNFSVAFAYLTAMGSLNCYSDTFSGGATGSRYFAGTNSVIFVNGAPVTYLPGNAAGSLASGGQYA